MAGMKISEPPLVEVAVRPAEVAVTEPFCVHLMGSIEVRLSV